MQRRLLYLQFHIDANLINSKQKLPEVNQLEWWEANEVILIVMSGTARKEALVGNDRLRTGKTNQRIFTLSDEDTPIEGSTLYVTVDQILFPGGAANENQRNDVLIICEAHKYGAILVTGDGGSKRQPRGILGSREVLKHLVTIMSPVEAVGHVRNKIAQRDEHNRRVVREFGGALPSWTGAD